MGGWLARGALMPLSSLGARGPVALALVRVCGSARVTVQREIRFKPDPRQLCPPSLSRLSPPLPRSPPQPLPPTAPYGPCTHTNSSWYAESAAAGGLQLLLQL